MSMSITWIGKGMASMIERYHFDICRRALHGHHQARRVAGRFRSCGNVAFRDLVGDVGSGIGFVAQLTQQVARDEEGEDGNDDQRQCRDGNSQGVGRKDRVSSAVCAALPQVGVELEYLG